MLDPSRGQIITFYSYKGGTGRTMALANTACILAERQRNAAKSVLMIDWDLEAPGLHRYFRNRLSGARSRVDRLEEPSDAKPGLIDWFYEINAKIDDYNERRAKEALDTPLQGYSLSSEEVARKVMHEVDLDAYMLSTTIRGLSLLKAGRFNAKAPNEYSERVLKFNWESFYKKSPHLFRVFAEMLAEQYAYVLIDSRTGHTDISGICTALLPEKLVVVFTPNMQSVQGGLDLIRQATEYRKESADLRPLLVFPLVSRVEVTEPDLRNDWRVGSVEHDIIGYQPEFERLLGEVYQRKEIQLTHYFNEIQIQHIPRYAYGEAIAVLEEKSEDKFSLRRSYQLFATMLSESRVPWEWTIKEQHFITQKETKLSSVLSWIHENIALNKVSIISILANIIFIIIVVVLSGYVYSSRVYLNLILEKTNTIEKQLAK